jgi:hypothetical protein
MGSSPRDFRVVSAPLMKRATLRTLVIRSEPHSISTTVERDDKRWAAGVGVCALLVYVATMYRTLAGGDSGDLVASACRLSRSVVRLG